MTNSAHAALRKGFETAFIDRNLQSNPDLQPQFISNDYKQGKKVLSSIEEELLACDEFSMSVAFITIGGLTPLLQTLETLRQRGVKGRVLTTDYLNFSDPTALEKLASLDNIELRMFRTEEAGEGFHTKGYMFKREDVYHIITGSSNMTLKALTLNREWNTKLISTEEGAFATDLLREFEDLWDSNYTYAFQDFIDTYRTAYSVAKEQRRIAKQAAVPSLQNYRLKPNSMQVEFINRLEKIRADGEGKALLISATGTGKTYASAFAMREEKQNRVLFLVHREQIARQAMGSYRNVFGETKTFGLLSGTSKDFDTDYLFSTMQMMAKPEIMQRFDPEEFDTIIIDEVHRAGADSYQRIMQYFRPRFWLGMTASPDRTDGFDIYGLFDHNIAYEIRLQKALEENLLCPFHYFGITDIEIDGAVFDDASNLRDFNRLVCDQRVDYILQKAEYYGHSGDRVKGLIFCSRKEEGRELSVRFNERGYHTLFLSGEDSQDDREAAIRRLVDDDHPKRLDYIFTVDIFNEGVDIPEINQVIMLRPTESPIVFVQQLGRGLRKANDKEYVVILDFIGNYTNNFMIPLALYGDRSYNKDTIRRCVMEGARVIPGSSTIHFDEISKKRIFQSIDAANFNDTKLIRESYQQLKFKLGRIPDLMDFEEYGSIDVLRIFENKSKKMGSYHKFLASYEPDYLVKFDDGKELMLEFLSKKFASGKRAHELLMLRHMLHDHDNLMSALEAELEEDYDRHLDEKTKTNLANIMTGNFATGSAKGTYGDCVLIEKDGEDYRVAEHFEKMLEDPMFARQVEELVEFGLYRNEKDYGDTYQDTAFQLYAKYTYEDVCRLLNWEKGEVALNIGGYKYDKKTKTYPVFINYDKQDDIADTIRYEDRFVSPDTLIAISKSGRSVDSEDVMTALHARELGVDMELFVRKNKDDKVSKEFYYLGKISATGWTQEFTMPNTTKTAVEIEYRLDTPVRADLYDYITRN